MISSEQLQEYKRIYKEHFGKDISDAEALESATKLISLVKAVYKPMTKKEFEFVEERRKATLSEPVQ
jgi:hypothetical protein